MKEYIKPQIKKIDGVNFIKVSDVIQIIETHAANMSERVKTDPTTAPDFNKNMLEIYIDAHDHIKGFLRPFE